MEKTPAKQIVSNVGAVVSGLLTGLIFLFIWHQVDLYWKGWTSRVMVLPLGMAIWLAIVWLLIGSRTFALLLGSSLGMIACIMLATSILFPEPSERFLKECPTNELRFVCYYSSKYGGDIKINLETGLCMEDTTHAFHTVGEIFPTFTPDQLEKIKTALVELPSPSWKSFFFGDKKDDQFQLAFYRYGHLKIYRYSREDMKPKLGELSTLLDLK